jgi:hypothetical protein
MSDIAGKMAEWRKTLCGTGPCPVPYQENFTLTDAERECLENCIYASERIGDDWSDKQAAILCGLLARLSPPAT